MVDALLGQFVFEVVDCRNRSCVGMGLAVHALEADGRVGIGVGSVVLTANLILLGGYTLGCHSFRHLVGGRIDCLSCGKNTARYRWWKFSTWLNVRHPRFAWLSLFGVALTDLYVRLVSMGVIKDLNTWS